MTVTPTELSDVLLVTSPVFHDERGWFQELWNSARVSFPGMPGHFPQDNLVFSRRGVLRGLHFQDPHPQGKLVTVLEGEIFDVAVDVRTDSSTFGHWVARTLEAGSGEALYIPTGFAHGYQVLSERAYVLYKCSEVHYPEAEHAIAWNDPVLAIGWPLAEPILSAKDRSAPTLSQLNLR